MIKILNLYSGIGGNRKLWMGNIEVTAVENNQEIADIYKEFFPQDKVIVTDAHEYLLEHYSEYDFIWSSPPCQTHSQIRFRLGVLNEKTKPVFPDLSLYQEILFLQTHFKGKWVVENTISYYKPLIEPQKRMNHFFWSNFLISEMAKIDVARRKHKSSPKDIAVRKGFNLDKFRIKDKRLLLRNCVESEVGLHVFNCAYVLKQEVLE